MTRCHSSMDFRSDGEATSMPALFTQMSTPPNENIAASNRASTHSFLLTSACTAAAAPPASSMARTVSRAPSSSER